MIQDLDGINISIDSLNRETFKKLTGHDRLPEILVWNKNFTKIEFQKYKRLMLYYLKI